MLERTLRKDAEERRQIILKKAAMLFAEHGVDQVSMRHIAREAGVGQGTLYRSYTNKGELCWDLIGESCIQNNEKMYQYLNNNTEKSKRERLETVLMYHLESLEVHSPVLAAIQANTSEAQQSMPFYSEHYESVHAIIVKLLEEIAEAQPSNIVDPIFTADACMATVRPDVYLFMRQHRNYTPDQIKHRLFNVFVDPLFQN
ncbi:TetR/AcrR family transcriptional regulator [Paenibacillus sp. R14(2021)]|uniref:TetR/AcrR family transcriptional regulator n=1 Tax=Paenibacillus sp. R14(2021) TaxID=2859228 RepID=UPI001C612B1B|nr:TetR/AcrR family transcriptional regulator [Paenibacillus sp. R14(2021)]